jgi:hypothetical protein
VWRWSGWSCRAVRSDGRLLLNPWGSVNLIDELREALMPPRRRVWFLLGSAVSSSILRGDSETERLLEEVVDDGLDDDDPFFFVKNTCSFLPWLQHSPSQLNIRGFQPVIRYTYIILESGLWVKLGCVLLHETSGVDG